MTSTDVYGAFDTEWTISLQRGPYVSEKRDAGGTYFRAPPGGVSVKGKEGEGFPGQASTLDGGFYLPDRKDERPRLYAYFSTTAVEYQPSTVNCSSIGYTREHTASGNERISFVSSSVGTGIGTGLSLSNTGVMTQAQGIGTGVVGGAIAGVILSSLVNSTTGKIVPVQPPLEDTAFFQRLRQASSSQDALEKIK